MGLLESLLRLKFLQRLYYDSLQRKSEVSQDTRIRRINEFSSDEMKLGKKLL